MRFPIKFNNKAINSKLRRILPVALDPRGLFDLDIDPKEFSRLMSVFKFGNTFKTTSFNRYPKTQNFLSNYNFLKPPVVLDVGSSDGLASLGLISKFEFKHYYLTDLNPFIYYKRKGDNIYFYDEKGLLILFSSSLFIIYTQEVNWLIAKLFFNRTLEIDKKALPGLNILKLLNPLIETSKSRVEFLKYDMFEEWTRESVDLVIFANILNRTYFSDAEITKVVDKLIKHCNEGALIAIVDNRPNTEEKSSIFKVCNGELLLEQQINEGTEIEKLLLQKITDQSATK